MYIYIYIYIIDISVYVYIHIHTDVCMYVCMYGNRLYCIHDQCASVRSPEEEQRKEMERMREAAGICNIAFMQH